MSRPLLSPAGPWQSLFDTGQNKFAYLGKALLLDLPLCVAVGAIIGLLSSQPGPDFSSHSATSLIFLACGFAPVLETALMVAIFGVLRWFTVREHILVSLSGLVWAVLHSTSNRLWGLGVFWPFLLYSICYLNWEKRSQGHAFLMTTAFHALHNLFLVLVMLLGRAFES